MAVLGMERSEEVNPLAALLRLTAEQKKERGLLYTPQEVAQQPATWLRTFEMLQSRQHEIREFLDASGLCGEADRRPTVLLIGAGTSDYIGHSVQHLLRRMWQCEVIPVASTSLLTDFDDYLLPERRYLCISFSRSGDSPEGVAVLERALTERPDIAHVLVTCNAAGKMNRAVEGKSHCLAIVLDEETNDRGLAMTSSFSNMVVTGQFLGYVWKVSEYEPVVHALSKAGESLLPRSASLASELAAAGHAHACFVGTAGLAGAAMESALKMLELTAGAVQTMSQSTLGLRHGPMAALHRGSLLVAFVSSQPRRRNYELDLLREIGSKGLVQTRVAVAADAASLTGEAECVLAPEDGAGVPDLCRPALDVIFGQLLGLFASMQCGLRPDAPSPSGAISRVVPGLVIY